MKNMEMELRFNPIEFRAEDDGTLKVSGYVNKTGQYSQVLGGAGKRFKEKIKKGCFSRALISATWDIDFLDGHDESKILSSTRNSSLTLREDDTGLYMEATIEPTSYGTDCYTLIKSGILRSMSFGFRVLKDSWQMIEQNLFERTVEEMELYEVSVVREPAYTQSTIAARGINVIEDIVPEEVIKEGELMEELRKQIEEMTKEIETLRGQVKDLTTENEAFKEEARKLEEAKAEEQRKLEEEEAKRKEEEERLAQEKLEEEKRAKEQEEKDKEAEAQKVLTELNDLKNILAGLKTE